MARSSLSMAALPNEARETLARLGHRIRQARLARNLTLEEMAARVFVTAKTLRRIECGDPGVSMALLASTLLTLGRLPDIDALVADDRISALQARRRHPRRASPPKDKP